MCESPTTSRLPLYSLHHTTGLAPYEGGREGLCLDARALVRMLVSSLSLAAEYISPMSPLTLVLWVDDVTLRVASTHFFDPTPFPAFHLFHGYVRMRVCVVAVLPPFVCVLCPSPLMGSSARCCCYALSFTHLAFRSLFHVSTHGCVRDERV